MCTLDNQLGRQLMNNRARPVVSRDICEGALQLQYSICAEFTDFPCQHIRCIFTSDKFKLTFISNRIHATLRRNETFNRMQTQHDGLIKLGECFV
ncbi:hypothetical protein D3C76_1495770 [compost metagenome]